MALRTSVLLKGFLKFQKMGKDKAAHQIRINEVFSFPWLFTVHSAGDPRAVATAATCVIGQRTERNH